jgi:hypothetical protein
MESSSQVEEKKKKQREKKYHKEKKNAKKGGSLPFFSQFCIGMKGSYWFLLSTFLQR